MTAEEAGPIAAAAPAKVNLYLHVTGRKADGYHLLDTLMVFTELGDRIVVRPGDGLSLTADGPFADRLPEEPGENLVMRAAHALADAAGIDTGAHITLTKNLPVAAGLGSGSSDAAATLRALARLWAIPEGAVDLAAIGLALGSDIPACLHGKPAFVGGTGDQIEDAPPLPACDILLVNPGVQLATLSVFGARKGGFSPEDRFAESPADVRALAALIEERGNDLTEPATRLLPVIGQVLSAIEAAPGCRVARMSGSGATCFGLFDDAETAGRAMESLRRDDWWCAVTRFGG